MLPARSQLERHPGTCPFLWASGIEDTIIPAPDPATGRVLDAYRLTGHTRCWREDFAALAHLGVAAVRYGIPWHIANPESRRFAWDWADRRIDRLLQLGIEPIIDLLHYGVPPWLTGGLLAHDFPARLAEFAQRMAERFRGRVRWYTPVNEPRITAWYCGKLGWWPPYRHGWGGFVAVLLALARATVMTVAALRATDRNSVDLHVDATDRYVAIDPPLRAEAAFRQQLGFLALDLVSGRVRAGHSLLPWLRRWGAPDRDLAWLQAHARPPTVIGLNFYPIFSLKTLVRAAGTLRVRMPMADAGILSGLVRDYWTRYGRPLMISETASRGPVARRLEWLQTSVAAVGRLRRGGVPLIGYTWWPLFALYAWGYARGRRPLSTYLQRMGLYELSAGRRRGGSGAAGLVGTALVDAYRRLVDEGDPAKRNDRGPPHAR